MSTKYKAQAIIFQYDADGMPTWTTIGALRDMEGPSLLAENTDATTHDAALNNYRDSVVTLHDTGDMSFEIAYDPADTGHQWLYGTGRAQFSDLRITWPDTGATKWAFKGQVTNFTPKGPVDGLLTADVTIKCKGAITVS